MWVFFWTRLRYLTSVAPLPGSVCVVWTDSLQRMLLLPEAVHTLVSDGGKGAFHQFTVQWHPRLQSEQDKEKKPQTCSSELSNK